MLNVKSIEEAQDSEAAGEAAPSLGDIAAQVMQQCRWDIDAATELLIGRCRNERWLRERIIAHGCRDVLRSVSADQRERLISFAHADPDHEQATRNSNARLRRAMESSYLVSWMVDGVQLGKATDEDLSRSIAMRLARAKTEHAHAAFEKAILKKIEPGKTVEECLDEKAVLELARVML